MARYLRFFLLLCFTALPHYAFAEETPIPPPSALENWNKQNESREKAEDAKFSELWSKSLLVLAVAIGILFIATWVMKHFERFKPKTSPQDARIKILEKRMLSQKSCIYLLQIDNHKIIVTESINGTQQPYELEIKPHTDIHLHPNSE